jgi:hypothetical protein
MASVSTPIVPTENGSGSRLATSSAPPPIDGPLFHFGLRQLLSFVAALCGLLTAVVSSSGMASVLILLAVAVVVMHVFATALGTRLQSRAERERLRQEFAQPTVSESNDWATRHSTKLLAIRSAPRSPWHGRGCTYLPWLPRLVVGAMIAGGLGGGVLLSGLIGDHASLEGIIVGAASFAVLGGWISFLGGNFYGVFRHGLREAVAEQKKDQVEFAEEQQVTPTNARSSRATPGHECPSRDGLRP